ncbi:MAG: VWA domain-containing protein [Proteobacteria bacterium]|nr:VWA domain-containing protein [Pseudomonadota bacterium]MBU1057655.1 VWA domain-containing protein [Pseudomonadota bacterium]
MITFAEPLWIGVGVVFLVGLILLYREMQHRRKKELERFAASHLLTKLCKNVSSERRTVKKVLVIAAIGCCFLALARPQYGFKWVEVKRKGIDILFAVDTSKSMLAEDIRPNRLRRAKFAIMDFVSQLEGDRVGLLPFAGSAFCMCPLTIDYDAFESTLEALDTTIIPKGGTDLAAAITEAVAVLSNEANHKILVFITDGENLEGDALGAARAAAEKGMTIYTVGVGTREGELIPLTRNGKTGFVKEDGKFITSQLDETMLTQIAEATGGLYRPLGANGEGLQDIYKEKLSLVPKEELAEKRHKVALERFVWPLGAAIVFLGLEFIVSGRKSRRAFGISFIKTAGRRRKKAAALLLLLFLFPTGQRAEASKGEDAYREGDYLTASQFYDERLKESPDDARLHFNYGTAAYKNNMFEEAVQAFNQALKSDDLALQQEAYYNRGNALFQRGNETRQTDPQHTMEMWQQAVDSFDGALQLDSVNDDARYNLELVKRQLEELKKQQEEEDKNKEQNQEKDKDGKQEKKDDQDQGESQDQDQDQNQDQNQNQGQDQDQNQDQEDKEQAASGQDQENKDGQQNQQDQAEQSKESPDQSQAKKDSSGDKEGDQAEQPETGEEPAVSEEEQEQQAQARDQQRRLQGKMTREEARQLLNSFKDKEGELNFIPASVTGQGQDQETRKDW